MSVRARKAASPAGPWNVHAAQAFRCATPAGGREAERCELPGRVLTDRAEAGDADAAMDGVDEILGLPPLRALAFSILVDVAVVTQREVDGVLLIWPTSPSSMMRVIGTPAGSWSSASRWSTPMPSDTISFNVGEGGDQPAVRFPGQGDLDLVLVAERLSRVRKSMGPRPASRTFFQRMPSVSRLI